MMNRLSTSCSNSIGTPVYASFRDRVRKHADAEDLTQRFFAQLNKGHDIQNLDPQKGRFRAFLKAAIKNLYANYVDEVTALKRGHNEIIISIDEALAEKRYASEPFHEEDPATLFDRRWIATILESAKTDLRREYAGKQKSSDFEALEDFLIPNARDLSYANVADQTGQKEGTVRVAAFRIRKRYRELIRDHIFENRQWIQTG